MIYFTSKLKPLSIIMILIMIMTAAPYQAAYASMISTGTAVDTHRALEARDFMNDYMARADVRQELVNMGVSPQEAEMRVAALSDAEIISLSDTIKDSPAGAGAIGAVVGAALIIFLVMLITDITGHTNVYNFTR